jgi:hypothetical protein
MKRECTVAIEVRVMVSGQEATDRIATDVELVVLHALADAGYEPVIRSTTARYVPRPINRGEASNGER